MILLGGIKSHKRSSSSKCY